MRKLLALTLLLMPLLTAQAQVKTDSARAPKDPGFLLASLSYTSNNNATRLMNPLKMPAFMANVSYYSKFGVYGSADYFKYLAPDTNTYEAEFKLGYQKTFFDAIDLDFSYTNRTFRGDRAYEGISYNHDLVLSGAYRVSDLSIMVDNSFMIGDTRNYFLDMSLSYDFRFEHVLLKNASLSVSPTLTASFGTNFWIPGTIDHIWGHHPGMGHPPPFVMTRKFDYQCMSLIVPVQYTIGPFTLGLGGFYAIPSNTLKNHKWTDQSGFLVSLNYALIF